MRLDLLRVADSSVGDDVNRLAFRAVYHILAESLEKEHSNTYLENR